LFVDFLREQAIRALKENVEKNSELERWLIYEYYEIIEDEAGNRYIHAPHNSNGATNKVAHRSRPLSRASADLFITFARWPEEEGMDKELDTKRNAAAALRWAQAFGVLGLNPASMTVSMLGLDFDLTIIADMVNSRRVTADYLGQPALVEAGRGRRNSARGGQPEETVANFAFEAWEAHIAWRLYESVRQEAVDTDSIIEFMSTIDHFEADMTAGPSLSWVERDIYSQDPELTRRWALTVVGDAVNRKIENYCYPIIRGDAPGSYERGWAFKSLLGAMWLQMMFLMREDRRCWWCGRPLNPGMPRHARFCKNNGLCRSKWNYHKGSGKSSKHVRKQERYIR
jgi:hypothetical protein